MKKYTMYIGLNDKDSHAQEITTLDAYKVVTNLLLPVGGATITEGRGLYTHDNGTVVVENTLVCVVFGGDKEVIVDAVQQIKQALNQESIAVEETETNSTFI